MVICLKNEIGKPSLKKHESTSPFIKYLDKISCHWHTIMIDKEESEWLSTCTEY